MLCVFGISFVLLLFQFDCFLKKTVSKMDFGNVFCVVGVFCIINGYFKNCYGIQCGFLYT